MCGRRDGYFYVDSFVLRVDSISQGNHMLMASVERWYEEGKKKENMILKGLSFTFVKLEIAIMNLFLFFFAPQLSGEDLSGDVEEVKQEGDAEEDEVWDAMETVTDKTKKRANEEPEAVVTEAESKKKRKMAKK